MLLTHWSKRPVSALETTDQCSGPKESQIGDGLPAGPKTSADMWPWKGACPQGILPCRQGQVHHCARQLTNGWVGADTYGPRLHHQIPKRPTVHDWRHSGTHARPPELTGRVACYLDASLCLKLILLLLLLLLLSIVLLLLLVYYALVIFYIM